MPTTTMTAARSQILETPVTQSPATSPGLSTRLTSLDTFRGLTMLLLISHGFGLYDALRGNTSMPWLAAQFDHAQWVGCTLWDLIQPAFTFIVGAAMPLSFVRRRQEGASRGELFRHVLWRACLLIL